jgi:DNA-binding IclR family transcriptional regulator
MTPSTNASQLRLLTVIEALSGNEVFGARLRDLARAVGVIDSTALRDLETLAAAGWAQKLPDNRWRLAAKPIQLLINFQSGLARAEEQVGEVRRNYTRKPL